MKYTPFYWKQMFALLKTSVAEKGRVVTIEDVMKSSQYKSKAAANHALKAWERMGLVEKDNWHWRIAK